MAFGIAEDPAHSPVTHLDGVDYPVWRDLLVRIAADNGASVEVINLFKCLPRSSYAAKGEVLRDLSEAARRFAMGFAPAAVDEDGVNRDRRNLGKDAVEGAPEGHTRHP